MRHISLFLHRLFGIYSPSLGRKYSLKDYFRPKRQQGAKTVDEIPKEMYEALGQLTMTKALVDSGLAEFVGMNFDKSNRKIDGERHETLHIEMTIKLK